MIKNFFNRSDHLIKKQYEVNDLHLSWIYRQQTTIVFFSRDVSILICLSDELMSEYHFSWLICNAWYLVESNFN